jgi:hypothetical protein
VRCFRSGALFEDEIESLNTGFLSPDLAKAEDEQELAISVVV